MKSKRKNYFIDRAFQSEFILKFFGLVTGGSMIFGIALYVFSNRALTTSFENSRLVVKSTADYLLPALLFGGAAAALISAAAASLVVIFMTHRISGPMYRFGKYARDIGGGKLSSSLRIREKDQFHEMADSFNRMREDLKAGLLKINEISERIGLLVNQLSAGEDMKKIVLELEKERDKLKTALTYFKISD
jgi:methyl-accepting chemotaxis protein